jgi:methylmalonyl-CoA/ethylmalonyl-CoA epimerase
MRLHHIAMAVKDIEASRALWEQLLGKTFTSVKRVESEDVLVSFCNVGACKLELVQAASTKSPSFQVLPHPILAFIEKRGEGLHHIAFESEHLQDDIERLEAQGIRLISSEPVAGAEGDVVFLNPEDCGGTLIELCKVKDDRSA